MTPTRRALSLAPLLALGLLACDGKDDAPPKEGGGGAPAERSEGETSGKAWPWEKRSADPVVSALQGFVEENDLDLRTSGWRLRVPKPPLQKFPKGKKYFWRLKTNQGELRVRLLPEVAPMHATSTIYLTTIGFYDGLGFHRVIQGFMAQGGDPKGDGTGGPGYKYASEISPDVRHDRPGLLSMANTGQPETDGSQFFLTFAETPWLDGKHTIFGQVAEGMDTLRKIESLAGPPTSGVPPKRPIVIEKATIEVE
jgi:cyclophilin family peptidyl-prolyl cis-trans isomerase